MMPMSGYISHIVVSRESAEKLRYPLPIMYLDPADKDSFYFMERRQSIRRKPEEANRRVNQRDRRAE